mgnify:FL=1
MPTPISTEAVHALTIEPHADGTYDPAASDLADTCSFALSLGGRVTTMRDRVDARGNKYGEMNTYRMGQFEPIVRDLAATGTTFLFTCNQVTPRTAEKYLRMVQDANFEVAGVVWNYDSPLGNKVERISRIVFRPRAGKVVA